MSPFGMLQPGREFSAGSGYRYGFNGKENDKDVIGDGNEYDYGYRIYNPRIGRWLSTDKLEAKYAFSNPYTYALNSPTKFSDPDGNLIWIPDASYAHELTAIIEKAFGGKIKAQVITDQKNLHSYLKFDLNKDVQLNEVETKAFEYLKSLADNPAFTIKINVYPKAFEKQTYDLVDGVSMDHYYGRVIYYDRLSAYNSGMGIDDTGEQLIHFFAEQFSGLVPDEAGKTDNQELRTDYNVAHDKALDIGLAIFNRKWTDAITIIKDNKKFVDLDYVDKEGKYICTVREIYDFADAKKPKINITTFIRTDIKVGDKSKGAILGMNDWAIKTYGRKYVASDWLMYAKYAGETRNAYYKNNPLPPVTTVNSNSTTKPKKKKNG